MKKSEPSGILETLSCENINDQGKEMVKKTRNKEIERHVKIVKQTSHLGSGTKCSIIGCYNYTLQIDRRGFYRYPKNDAICKKWVEAANCKLVDDHYLSKGAGYLNFSSRVCSDHFEEKYLKNKNLLSQGIYKHAVPTKNLIPRTKPFMVESNQEDAILDNNNHIKTSLNTKSSQLIKKLNNNDRIKIEINNSTKILIPVSPPKNLSRKKVILLPQCMENMGVLKMGPPVDCKLCEVPRIKQEIKEEPSSVDKIIMEVNQLKTKLNVSQKKLRSAQSLLSKYRRKSKQQKTIISELRRKIQPKKVLNVVKTIHPLNAIPKRHVKGHKFSKNIQGFALDLYFSSPLSYNILQGIYFLPSIKTLKRWMGNHTSDNIVNNPTDSVVSNTNALNVVHCDIEIVEDVQYIQEELVGENAETVTLNADF